MQSSFPCRIHSLFFSAILLLLVTLFPSGTYSWGQELQGAHAQIRTNQSFDLGLRFYSGGSNTQMRVYIFSISKNVAPDLSTPPVSTISLWMTGSPSDNLKAQNDSTVSANCAASAPVYDPTGALQSKPYTCGAHGDFTSPNNTTCALGDLNGILGPLPPPGTFSLVGYTPFSTLSGPMSIMGLGVQVLSGTKSAVSLGCGIIQPLHVSLFPEPSPSDYSVLNYAYYQKDLQQEFGQESRSKFILSIVLILALRNFYHALSLSVQKRHRAKPQFWIISFAIACQILIHLPAWIGSIIPSAAISCLTADTIGFAAGYTTTFCITTVLLLRAYFANRRSPIILGIGATFMVILVINMCVTAASKTIPLSPTVDCLAPFRYFDASPAVLWIKIVTICVANTLLSGCFLLQVFRQRLRTPTLIYKTLMKDGILYCVCVSISNILFPVLYVAHALQEQSFSFWSLDYMVATTLLVEQIRHQHRLLTDPRLSQYTVTTSDRSSSSSKLEAPSMSHTTTLDPQSYSFYADSILSPYGNAKGSLRVVNGDSQETLNREPSFTGRSGVPTSRGVTPSETQSTGYPEVPLPIPAAFRDRNSLDTIIPTPLPHTPALCSSQASPGLNRNRSPLESPKSPLGQSIVSRGIGYECSTSHDIQRQSGDQLGYAAFRMSKASSGQEHEDGRISPSRSSLSSSDSCGSSFHSLGSSADEENDYDAMHAGHMSYVTVGSQARPGSPVSDPSSHPSPEQTTFQDHPAEPQLSNPNEEEHEHHSVKSRGSAQSTGLRGRGLIKMEGTWFDIQGDGDPSAGPVISHDPSTPTDQHSLPR
ncbi:MAG: hypothetical protein DHS80DRAFT_23853 [Piptocephalis tieghemiana]|nr:MAG: hypothetical protein DHS80DRAFT_23853 [Piptocephalis tieghemiana]